MVIRFSGATSDSLTDVVNESKKIHVTSRIGCRLDCDSWSDRCSRFICIVLLLIYFFGSWKTISNFPCTMRISEVIWRLSDDESLL